MAITFGLKYNNGLDYVDLFPKTNIKSIADSHVSKQSIVYVTIPQYSGGLTQEVQLVLTQEQQSAPFYVKCESSSVEALRDYSKISQIGIFGNTLRVIRLGEQKSGEIRISLCFEESEEQ